ncbi:hypothetical protein BLNAU_4784 [Blattamonas nauphoetae]|uniref:Protein kinase domain-containing protein n=1 Tax=Blattamonas nauphoetae TaxID=2049346 RepID=A0ABQ9Y953_9EUKA|nr:hypothetical protein BLNAU_4784 [Blattamonas nauphoetae]
MITDRKQVCCIAVGDMTLIKSPSRWLNLHIREFTNVPSLSSNFGPDFGINMPFLSLLTVLLTISISHHHNPSPQLLPLQKLLPLQRNTAKVSELKTKSDIVLPNGRYHTSNFEITSTTLNLNGKESTIFPSFMTHDEDLSEDSVWKGFWDSKEDRGNALFLMSNCTTWMSELRFECGSGGWSIARIWGSCVGIVGSRVISNSERTPFVIVGGDSGKSSSITIIDCSHTSSYFPWLLPLTSLDPSDCWATHNSESWGLRSELLVTGSDLEVCDAYLIGGTGPLFDFSRLPPTTTDRCSIATTLASSLLLNTTSDYLNGSVDEKEGGCDFGDSETVSQNMIGSCVSHCTNHLCGTGIRDPNLGGSVLCSNTSFTHCTTTTTEYSNQHLTSRTQISKVNSHHSFSLCTFKACSGPAGAALYLFQISDLEIASCSFDSCSASGSGGAIYFYSTATSSSVVISSSSFVQCSSNSYSGGSLTLQRMMSLSISDCGFLVSQTTEQGGALSIIGWDAQISNTGLSNCLFEDCATSDSSNGGGGALFFNSGSSIRLASLRFRECVAATGNGHDLYFYDTSPLVSLSTVSNCDSTSTLETSRIYPTDIPVDDVLPTPTETTTILSLKAQQTSSTTAEIVVTLDKKVTGSFLVLVSNSEGTSRTDPTKAPNIGRVLVFSIESSKIGRWTVSTGETGLLQLPLDEYKIVTSSFSGIFVLPPTFTSAKCDLDDSCIRAILNLEGSDVNGESFELTLQNGWTLKATFTDNKATIDLGVIGETSNLMENQMFVITSGKKKDDDSIVVSIPSPLYFTIPEAAHLINIVVSNLNEATYEVTLSFSCRLLKPEHDYAITLERKDGSGRVVMDVRTNSSGLLTEQTVKLYPSNGNKEELKNWVEFGEEYKVIGFSAKTGDGDSPIQFSPILVKMPLEPVRITSALCTDDDPDRTVVTVKGSGFILGEFYTVSVSGYPIGSPPSPPPSRHETSFVVTALSTEEAISSPLQLHPAEGSKLKFSFSYSIVNISNGSMIGVVHSVVFDTQDDVKRDEALITKIEVVLASSLNTSIMVEVWGSNLPSETVGVLTLDASFSFDVSFSSSSFGRSAVLELGVSGSLGFGSEYSITSLEDSNKQTIQIPETTIKTPPKPSQLSLCVCGEEERAGMEMMEPASLRANPSTSQHTSTLVSVEEGGLCRLSFLAITADLSVSTFKLVSASKGIVVIRSCWIEGTRQNEMNNEDGSICGWLRGLIELIETDTELNGVSMKEIAIGALWMRGGKLNITKSEFSQNGPSIADFPSARQNIHCEGEGVITIHSLSEGDGTKNSPSTWMDVSECRMEGDEDIARSPLFVPTLSSTESTVETDKSGKQTAKVVGKTLMPCGLSLEVFEWDSSKSVEGKSELVDLSTSSATHWNETEIMIPFSESDVVELNRKMEWRGRLVFGNGERTSNWMVVSGLSSGNKSLGGVGSKWWIPVLICVSCGLLVSVMIVVCVCLRRKQHSAQNELLKNEEMSAGGEVEEEEKMEEHDLITDQSNSAITSVPSAKEKQGSSFGETRYGSEEVIPRLQSCVEVIVCNGSIERSVAVETDTLFNALHNAHSTRFLEKGKVGSAIARGLVSLVEMKVMADVLTRLSPHWVLFDTKNRVSLKTRETLSVLGESGIVGGGMKTSEDGQRWMAPEVGQANWERTKENADHGAVFSLGLVLWEMETGLVPFGEVDGPTAQRRLASGEKPAMEKVSSSMEAIILQCLSLDPSQRPSLKAVLSQLDELNGVADPLHKKEGNAMSHVLSLDGSAFSLYRVDFPRLFPTTNLSEQDRIRSRLTTDSQTSRVGVSESAAQLASIEKFPSTIVPSLPSHYFDDFGDEIGSHVMLFTESDTRKVREFTEALEKGEEVNKTRLQRNKNDQQPSQTTIQSLQIPSPAPTAETKMGKKPSLAPLSPAKPIPNMSPHCPRKQRSKWNLQPLTEQDVENSRRRWSGERRSEEWSSRLASSTNTFPAKSAPSLP